VAAHAETARYAALSRASGDAILGLSLDGAVNAWSRGAERLLGYTAEEMIGKHISVLAPEGFETEQCSLLEQVQSGKEVLPYDTVRRHKDGTLVPVSIRAAPILTAEETPIGVSETMRDITDRKQAEERTALLTQELAHRTKNLLSLVHAVMLQTANHSSNKDSFIRSVDERLRAMAQAQDLLIANTLKGALVSDLVRSCLKPFIVNEASLEMHGPPVFLKADVVHNLSLVLHELASNALKYGALTQAHGRVFVIWELDGAEVISRRFRISWREVDGPPVIPPQRRGFGTEVINEVPKYELGAEITLDYAPTGLQWRLDMPADRCVDVGQ
jgi:PAS domain S-box-containing protein